jgi:tetratricopeptide (TPR) repeat protein
MDQACSLHEVLARADLGEAYRHLLTCGRCRERATEAPLDADETWDEPLSAPMAATAGRTVAALRQRLALTWADRDRAADLTAELLARPPEVRSALAACDQCFASPAVAGLLLGRAESSAVDDPLATERFARLALEIADRLPVPWARLEREALLGRGRTWIGEALRLRGDLSGAGGELAAAHRHLELLPIGSPERGDYCRLLARLRGDEGRGDEALALLLRAAEVFEDLAERARLAECRLEQGRLLLDEVEARAALGAFEEAAVWFRSPETFREWLDARRGLALCYAELNRDERALNLVEELKQAVAARPPLDRLRVGLVEAEVAQSLDDPPRAAVLLAELWPALYREGEVYLAVDALLDLAGLHVEQGQPEEIDRLAAALLSILELPDRLRDVVSGVFSSLRRQGLCAFELVEIAKHYLARARYNPSLPFPIPLPPGEAEERPPPAEARLSLAPPLLSGSPDPGA